MRPPHLRALLALLSPAAFALASAGLARAQYPVVVLTGAPGEQLGFALARAGDADGDGRADLALGARHASVSAPNAGAVVALSGADASELWRVEGLAAGERLGSALARAGDLDGDGRDDLIAGAPFADPGNGPLAGCARVLSGLDGSLLLQLDGAVQFDLFGSAVAGGARVDADTVDDLVVGAPNADGGGVDSGVVFVCSGAGGAPLFAPAGDQAGDLMGTSVLLLGDVNQDGRADFAAGAPRADLGGTDAGLVRVWSGLDGSILYTVLGAPGSELGHALAGIGDLDLDGRPDFAAGAWLDGTNGPEAGRVTLHSGVDGSLIDTLGGLGGSRFGAALASAGDVDGDGLPDVIVGAPGEGGVGAVHVVSGADRSLLQHLVGGASGTGLGSAVAGGIDLDGDSLADYATGAALDSEGGPSSGRATIWSSVDNLGSAYCFGDGSGTPCPCGNEGASDAGCRNSTGAGATLACSGSASAAADDLQFLAAHLPAAQPALLFAGLNATAGGAGLAFGDGLRCAGGAVVRLGVQMADAGGTAAFGPGLLAQGGMAPGETRRFQAWYRDPQGSPCGLGFNLSPGYELAIKP